MNIQGKREEESHRLLPCQFSPFWQKEFFFQYRLRRLQPQAKRKDSFAVAGLKSAESENFYHINFIQQNRAQEAKTHTLYLYNKHNINILRPTIL